MSNTATITEFIDRIAPSTIDNLFSGSGKNTTKKNEIQIYSIELTFSVAVVSLRLLKVCSIHWIHQISLNDIMYEYFSELLCV